jgi:phage regulator Rha-like protein
LRRRRTTPVSWGSANLCCPKRTRSSDVSVTLSVVSRELASSVLAAVSIEAIQQRIHVIRGNKVMLDQDLAELYGVQTKRLLEQVRRNSARFPADFMFRLDSDEVEALRSQNATSTAGRGGRRYAPYAFTEQGVAMLSSVLRSPRAIAVNIEIMRAFVALRHLTHERAALARRLDELEARFDRRLAEHDEQLAQVFAALRQLLEPPPRKKRPIGFA